MRPDHRGQLVRQLIPGFRCFGVQVAAPPPILKALPKIFDHKDKTVRAEGTALVHTLYQYLGPAIESFLGDLKPVQVKELKEAFEGLEKEGKGKGSIKPERLTKQQAREAEAQGDAGDDAADDAPAEGTGHVHLPPCQSDSLL